MLFRASPIFSPKANRVRFKTEGSGKNGRVQNRAEKRAGPVCGKAIAFSSAMPARCRPSREALDFITSKNPSTGMPVTTSMRISCATAPCAFRMTASRKAAGMPVLDVLRKSGVTDVVTVATRFRRHSARGRRSRSRVFAPRVHRPAGGTDHYHARVPAVAHRLRLRPVRPRCIACSECGGVTDDTVFEKKLPLNSIWRPSCSAHSAKKLADATNGQVDVTEDGKNF